MDPQTPEQSGDRISQYQSCLQFHIDLRSTEQFCPASNSQFDRAAEELQNLHLSGEDVVNPESPASSCASFSPPPSTPVSAETDIRPRSSCGSCSLRPRAAASSSLSSPDDIQSGSRNGQIKSCSQFHKDLRNDEQSYQSWNSQFGRELDELLENLHLSGEDEDAVNPKSPASSRASSSASYIHPLSSCGSCSLLPIAASSSPSSPDHIQSGSHNGKFRNCSQLHIENEESYQSWNSQFGHELDELLENINPDSPASSGASFSPPPSPGSAASYIHPRSSSPVAASSSPSSPDEIQSRRSKRQIQSFPQFHIDLPSKEQSCETWNAQYNGEP